MVYLGTSISSGNRSSVDNDHNDRNGGSNGHSNSDLVRSNQRDRSGNESSGDEGEGQIRVGKEYQIDPPDFIPLEKRRADQCPERALLVWSPCPTISNAKLDEYIQVSKEKYGYNAEQALGMLFWHKHDLDRAIQDLANFTPFPDEWSVEDKVLFEQAFQFHGKSFHRIRQMLPDKSIAQLVKYYYSWKKTRTRTSLMDRQARKLQAQREVEVTIKDDAPDEVVEKQKPNAENSISDEEEMEVDDSKPKCSNCGILCHVTHSTPKGNFCGTCHQYWNRTAQIRPTTGPARKDGSKAGGSQKYNSILKNSGKPPKGMYVNHDDLVALATGPATQGEQLLKAMDREIVSYKRTVQNNKQILSSCIKKTYDRGNIAPYRIPESESSKINPKWTQEEQLLGVQGVRKFGKNFATIAEVIGTKTESHVRSFYVNYRRRYNLDNALKEYEAEHGPSGIETPPAEPEEEVNDENEINGATSE